MPNPIAFPLLFLLVAAALFVSSSSQPAASQPRGFYINCGSDKEVQIGSIKWIQDEGFIAVGNVSAIDKPNLLPVLATLRYFPDATARKYCYELPVVKGTRYLVRTTYFYGGFDGGTEPPVFDQIVDGTRWSAVNTTDNFRRGMSTYFEMVAEAQGKTMSVCLARRPDTASSPFISSLEVVDLEDSMYNTTDFGKYVMSTVARNRFGSKGEIVSYPDDQYNRYWAPFTDGNPAVESHSPISPDDFWNRPPDKALKAGVTASRGKKLTVQWPPSELPAASYYVALYFQDTRTASPYSWRVFDVAVNGQEFFRGLNASAAGVMVYSSMMQLSGKTEIVLTPNETSPVGPLINAGEIYQIVPLGGRTATRDVVAMEDLARSLKNPPPDWAGDPCLPRKSSWTGVECSEGPPARVLSLDLKNHGLLGSLPDSIGNLTAMKTIYLSGNKLSGSIPDLSSMRTLTALRLDGNQFSGTIKPSMGKLNNLKELYLNNNNLSGQIPDSLKNKAGLDLRTKGNRFE
ncbi:probable leucine-rich repeat receptor-like protein kinase At2g28990 [Phragmites australis]|uniref:probable leucine-rich repeat receptor-like protein kinase At2g28990 n=1 Tax=Phragmites australis TaxID=29695 RepID=UPI002D799101|nr:probable leucine-rich repeat receptor-like protein kinase At2g28990 [Phragmites australis]